MIGKILFIGVSAGVAAHVGGLIRANVLRMQVAETHLVVAATNPNGAKAAAGIQNVLKELRGMQVTNSQNQKALRNATK